MSTPKPKLLAVPEPETSLLIIRNFLEGPDQKISHFLRVHAQDDYLSEKSALCASRSTMLASSSGHLISSGVRLTRLPTRYVFNWPDRP